MAVVRFVLAAKQASLVEEGGIKSLFDFPLSHQFHELRSYTDQSPPVFLICIQNCLGGGQNGKVDVVHPKDFPQKIFQVILFGESGELGNIVEPDAPAPRLRRVERSES